jgi:hypothetical protein
MEAEEEQRKIALEIESKSHKLRVYTKSLKFSGKKFKTMAFFMSGSVSM